MEIKEVNEMRTNQKPILGITMGDPAGIGPEITIRALSNREIRILCRPVVIGDADVFEKAFSKYGTSQEIHEIKAIDKADFKSGKINVLDVNNIDLSKLRMGEANAMNGNAVLEDTKKAVELASEKKIDGVVAGPHNKKAVNMAGHHFEGYPYLLAELTGTPSENVFNMLVANSLRVTGVTLHVPLKKVSDLLTRERILTAIEVVNKALKDLNIKEPKIVVAGLNPHAGEGGLWGDEEEIIIEPAIKEAQEKGIDVVGPEPSDSLWFNPERRGKSKYDAYIGMYHDQSHIAIKTLYFYKTVGMIIGTPILFATVSHGTAYRHAREGIEADPQSMMEAIKLVAQAAQAKYY